MPVRWFRPKVRAEVMGQEPLATENVAGVSMKAEKQQRTGKASRIGRQSAVSVLLFVFCIVTIFHTCNVQH